MRLRDLKNLGPKSEEWLPKVGIHSVKQLQASDPFEVYARLRAAIPGANLNALYAIIGAVEDRHWLDVKEKNKTEILLRLEQMGLAPK
ncbi:TfoX/Sxy family protein [Noviherbaspirillum massiliense]|uniref:TfoX/Sxy family protein n=1 Tax=Noviherbaspirillum massiliense TaxID=1465823 RepID=UPI0003814CA6|nr:TfoX/Sxy family protein [Noviherbaspirillum massiliense]